MSIPIRQRTYVPSNGPTNAKIALVGEAPGGEEEIAKLGFVGLAGQELDRMLTDGGIDRPDCFITNVFKVRPTNNEISEFVYQKKKSPGADWTAVPYKAKPIWIRNDVLPFIQELKQELTLLNPNVVVAIGGTALWALTNEQGIMKWRGSLLESTLVPGMKVIPVVHPSGILRQWATRWDAVQDLRRVKTEAAFSHINYPDWKFIIRPTFNEVMDTLSLVERIAATDELISVDIESSKGKTVRLMSCVGIAWTDCDAICIPFERKDGTSYWTATEEVEILHHLLQILSNPRCRIVGQNFLYDAYYFAFYFNTILRPWLDTLLGFHLLYPGKPKALHEQASLLCDYYRYWKDEGKLVDWRTPEEQIWIYNCQDVVYTREIARKQEKMLAQRPAHLWEFMKKRWDSALELMLRGVRRDETKKAAAEKQLQAVQSECKRQLDYILREDFNPRSTPQMKWLAYELFDLKEIKDRKTHSASVNDGAMDELGKQEPLIKPIFNRVRRFRSAGVLLSNFIRTQGPKGRMFSSFNPAGPETFRWSSSKNPFQWGCNLQNIMRDDQEPDLSLRFPSMRDMIIPDPGYFLFEVDLKSADLQVVVWESDEQSLKEALRAGKDIYVDCAADAGLSFPGPTPDARRQRGKMFIHLTDYGGTPRVAAIACKVKVIEADAMQKLWFKKYPGIKAWHERTWEELKRTRTVSNAFGLTITYFDRLDGTLKEALAWKPQTTVANITDYGIIAIREQLPRVQVLLNGHDAIVGQIPFDMRMTIGPILRQTLKVTVPYPDPLIIPWDLKIGNPSWGSAKKGCWECMHIKETCTCKKDSANSATNFPA